MTAVCSYSPEFHLSFLSRLVLSRLTRGGLFHSPFTREFYCYLDIEQESCVFFRLLKYPIKKRQHKAANPGRVARYVASLHIKGLISELMNSNIDIETQIEQFKRRRMHAEWSVTSCSILVTIWKVDT